MATPTITRNSLSLFEDQSPTLTLTNLDATVTEGSQADILFTIVPTDTGLAGEFLLTPEGETQAQSTLQFTRSDIQNQRVVFNHDGSNQAPSYSVQATSDGDTSDTFPATVTFVPVNEAPVFEQNSLTITEGETVTLTSDDLLTTDEPGESTAEELTYTIENIGEEPGTTTPIGQFQRVENETVTVLAEGETFTQAEVNNGLIQYKHFGGEFAPNYTLSVEDGGLVGALDPSPISGGSETVEVTFIEENDPPEITKNSFSLVEDTTITIGTNNINATDPDEPLEDNLEFIVTEVTNGRFVRQEEGGGITVLASPATEPIPFTRGEIFAGQIQFVNEPGTNDTPTYTLTVRDSGEPVLSDTEEGTVIFETVNDTPTLETFDIAIEEGGQVTLSTPNLLVQDEESAPENLTYEVTELSSSSRFVRLADDSTATTFTQADINAGNVIAFEHSGSTVEPSFSLTVTDEGGKSIIVDSGTGLEFGPVNDEPQVVRAQLNITEDRAVTLTAAENFLVTDEESLSGQLLYTVTIDNSDREQPDGFIINNGALQTDEVTFTQAQIGANQVQFVHGGSNLAPNLSITVTDEAIGEAAPGEELPPQQQANTIPVDLDLSFTAINDPPRFLLNTLDITEGEAVVLNPEEFLQSTDEETLDSNLVYTIDSVAFGNFERIDTTEPTPLQVGDTFTQGDVVDGFIQFQHDGSEFAPNYRLTVSDTGINDDPETIESVTRSLTLPPENFTQVNDPPTFENNTLTFSEGDAFFLTLDDISATDPDDDDDALVYTVTSVTNGRFERVLPGQDPVVLAAPDQATPLTFTQAEIEAGQIRFVNDPATDEEPTYTIQVEDLDAENPGVTEAIGNVEFTPENDSPVLTTLSFTLTEGDVVPLTPDVLAVVDEETPPEGITYTVDSVDGGSFVFADGTSADTFTQAEINAGNVVEFQHNGLNEPPTFSLTASDGVNEITVTETLLDGVTFTATNDEPEVQFSTFTVSEGGSVVLSGTDNLKTIDEESTSSELTYTVQFADNDVDNPDGFIVEGELFTGPTVTFTQAQVNAGQVEFVQGGSNNAPNLTATVTDEAVGEDPANEIDVPLTVNFDADNDEPNFITNTLSIQEGGTVVLNSESTNLVAEDEESGPEALTYTIDSVSNGEFQRLAAPDDPEPTPLSVGETFTQAEVNAGLIQFVHDGGELAPDYTLTVSDGGINNDPATIESVTRPLNIPEGGFVNVNDPPVFENNALTLTEGEAPFLTLDDLQASDVEDDDEDLIFTVTSVTNGRFERVTTVDGVEVVEVLASPTLETPLTFTQAEVAAGQIRFVNDPATDEEPTYTVQVQDLDPDAPGITTQEADVDFTAVNDEPVLTTLSFSLTEGEVVPLTPEVLAVVDEETPPEGIIYSVSTADGGSFVFADGTSADTFTQAQINAGDVVEFQHNGLNEAPTFSLSVTDGTNEITVTDEDLDGVTFTPVNDAPVVEASSFTVTEGDRVPITPELLSTTDEESPPEELVYNITLNNADPAKPDGFEVDGELFTETATFTQAQVDAGLVTFVQGGSNFPPNITSATVTDDFPAEFDEPITVEVGLTIGFDAVNDPPVVVNNTLSLEEGETVPVSLDNLLTTDEETLPENLTYTVDAVLNGTFERVDPTTQVATPIAVGETFTQADVDAGVIQFTHDGGEAAPSYTLTVTDTPLTPDGPVNSETFDLFIPEGGFVNVNDAPTLVNNTLAIAEGAEVTVNSTILKASDPDSVLSQLTFSFSNVLGGTFFQNGEALAEGDTFTGAAIAFEEITFVDDGDETPPSYTVTVADPQGGETTEDAEVVFEPINDAPEIITNFFTIKEGARLTLNDPTSTVTNLEATDSETPNELTYEVSGIEGGEFFKFVDFERVLVTSFSQEELSNGDINFLHDDSETVPTFNIKVTDPEGAEDVVEADITFIEVNDPPTLETAQLAVTEGVPEVITPEDLFATDPDSAAAELTFLISNLEGGDFTLVEPADENISGAFSGSITLTEEQIATALADGLYVNLHTQNFPNGELRGQIDLEAEGVLAEGMLAEAQQVDAVPDTAATGQFSAILQGDVLQVSGSYSNLTSPLQPVGGVDAEGNPESAIHVHVGAAGENGPILENLLVDETTPGTGATLTSFTLTQVETGQIQFVNDGDEVPATFTVTVEDEAGATSASQDVIVDLTRVNDDPTLTQNTFTITEGETLVLNDPTTDVVNLAAEDEETPAAELVFSVSNVVGGEFLDAQSQPLNAFTQAELNQGLVQFAHDGDETAPSFEITVTDAEGGTATAPADITDFIPVNDPPTLVNGTLTVTEGEATLLTTDNFLADDPDTQPENLVFDITELAGGEFTGGVTSFTQAQVSAGEIEFIDDGDQAPPTLKVSVSDGETSTDPIAVAIADFINVNDAPTAVDDSGEGFITDEQTPFVTQSVLLNDTDPDPGDVETLRVTQINGQAVGTASIELASGALVSSVGDGTFRYSPNGAFIGLTEGETGTDSFTYTVADAAGATSTATVTVAIDGINDEPTVETNRLVISQGETLVLSENNIAVTDPDADPSELVFTVSDLEGGQFVVNGEPVTTFTLQDILDGAVSFVQDGTDTEPSYSLAVTDDFVETAPNEVDVERFIPVNITAINGGIFDYEQFLRFQNTGATVPNTQIDSLPIAQLFDESQYLEFYQDVEDAVATGAVASGFDHFVQFGIVEGRNPSALFNEDFYLETYEDVANAIATGQVASGIQHFLTSGASELRTPSPAFNQTTYLDENDDVLTAIRNGVVDNGFEHYIQFGAEELRDPQLFLYNEAFYLEANPDVANAVNQGAFTDGFEHFVTFGQVEGRTPSILYDEDSYLALNPDVQNAVTAGDFRSGFAHYAQFGRFENRDVFA